jgi:hypothetical protein
MRTIEVDDEVFEYLKSQAEPFVDEPNDVLRRLFQLNTERPKRREPIAAKSRGRRVIRGDREAFMAAILEAEFGSGFRTRSPYRTLFENGTHTVYFQNFNKAGSANLWYRIKGSALQVLEASPNESYLVFTNPAEAFAFVLPVSSVVARMRKAGWDREDLEVNIDPATNYWRELEWDLSKHLKRYSPS